MNGWRRGMPPLSHPLASEPVSSGALVLAWTLSLRDSSVSIHVQQHGFPKPMKTPYVEHHRSLSRQSSQGIFNGSEPGAAKTLRKCATSCTTWA